MLKAPLILGLFFDYATSDSERDYILGAGLWLEVLPHFSLFAGAGVEKEEFPEVEQSEEGEGHEDETVLLGRFGAAYAYHFGAGHRWTLAPQAFLDVVERNNAWVLGVGFGYVF